MLNITRVFFTYLFLFIFNYYFHNTIGSMMSSLTLYLLLVLPPYITT